MNQKLSACDPRRIESFLDDRLAVDDELLLFEHIDHCLSCRALLTSQASDPETWNSVRKYLPNQEFDSVLLGAETDDGSDASSASKSQNADERSNAAQIKIVLNMLAPTDDPHMLGRLGGYEISGVVGAGGMGIVLKGHDISLDRTIAIKVLGPHLASSGAARQRFAREARAAAAVLHPNVIAIHGVSNDTEVPFLVMPFVRGRSLQKRLDTQGDMEIKEILRVGSQVAAGLAAAHAQGLIHRDIKPANILLEDGVERVTITDFGLARAVDDATLTRSGVIAGTPQYMSPEQASGQPLDARSDLFSLGSVLYAMCTGRPPFRAESTFGTLRRISDDAPRPIREINPEVPTWLCRLIECLHAKLPADRIQTAADVERILQECLAHLEQPDAHAIPVCLVGSPTKKLRTTWLMVACGLLLALLIIPFTDLKNWFDESPVADAKAPRQTVPEPDALGQTEITSGEAGATAAIWEDGVSADLAEIEIEIQQLLDDQQQLGD